MLFHYIMQFWSHSGQFYKNITSPAHVHGQKCYQTEKLVCQPKSDMGLSYYEWVVNLVLNIICFIVTILDMCKIIFFKYSLTHHKLKLSRRWRYNFFFSKCTHEEPKYIFQIISIHVLESKHQSSLKFIVTTSIN